MNSSTEEEVKDYSSSDDSIFDDEFHSKVSLGLSLRMKQIDNIGGQTCGHKSTNKDIYHELERSTSTCQAESKNKDNCIAVTVKSPSISTRSVMDCTSVDLTEIFENEEIKNQLYSTTNTKVEPSRADQSYNKMQTEVEPSGDDKIVNSIKKTPGDSSVTVNDTTFKLSELLEQEKITDQLYNEIQGLLPCDGPIATSQDSLIEDVLQDAPICQEIQNESECDHQQCDNDLISDLQKCVDQACNSLYKSWESSLCMDMCSNGIKLPNDNILKYVKQKVRKGDTKETVYFDGQKYSYVHGFTGDGYEDLCIDLAKEALKCGFLLIKNGFKTIRNEHLCQRFVCNRYLKYRGDKSKKEDGNYRTKSYHHDKRNSRGSKGRSMERMTTTTRAIRNENCCRFCFYVGHDHRGFFICRGAGVVEHKHHPKACQHMTFPTRLLSRSNREIVQDLTMANASMGVSVNFIYQRTGKVINRANVRWLSGLCNDLRSVDGLAVHNSTEKMIAYLSKNKIDHMILYNNNHDKQLYNECNLTHQSVDKLDLPAQEMNSATIYASKTRKALEVSDHQDLMIAMAWVLPLERDYLRLFPEVIFVDVIEDVNKDKRPLFTATGKGSDGKMFTFLRAFLPNQKQWIFRWLFSYVIPKLFGPSILRNVRLIISDGCVQEYSQIDDALKDVFPFARRVRCGFHIVRMGWKRKVVKMSEIDKVYHRMYESVCDLLKLWIYSWMRKNCETRGEYLVSKLMFFKFLNSYQIKKCLGYTFIASVENFVRDNVEPLEKHYCFYVRKYLRHFDEFINSLHEGTNNGLRHSAAPVGPSMAIEKTLVVMTNNSSRVAENKGISNFKELHHTKLYAKLDCSKHLVSTAYAILMKSWSRRNEYDAIRVAKDKWLVTFKGNTSNLCNQAETGNTFLQSNPAETGNALKKKISPTNAIDDYTVDSEHNETESPIKFNSKKKRKGMRFFKPQNSTHGYLPRFRRVRSITLRNGCLQCDCGHRARYGIDCSHIYCVVANFDNYREPSHHEVSVRWWSAYSLYGMSSNSSNLEAESNLSKFFHMLRIKEPEGLNVSMYSTKSWEIYNLNDEEVIPSKFRKHDFPQCINYEQFRVLPKDLEDGVHDVGGGITQSSCTFSNEKCVTMFDFNGIADDFLKVQPINEQSKRTPYTQLLPYFTELTSYMDGYYSPDDLEKITNFFQEKVAYFKGKASKEKNLKPSDEVKARFVSSTIPQSKKRKAHGTNY